MAKSKHDQFFSKSMEHPAMARSFFQQYLVQLSFLQLELDKFFVRVDRKNTDANLKQKEKDIIYQTRTKQGITVFLLVEHQSRPLWKMVLRLLQ